MSRFAVLAIADGPRPTAADLSRLLAPFRAYDPAERPHPFVRHVDETATARSLHQRSGAAQPFPRWVLESYCDYPVVHPGEPLPHGPCVLLARAGEIERVMGFGNPEARWRHWRLGGRWAGVFDAADDDAHGLQPCPVCAGAGWRTDEMAAFIRRRRPDFSCSACGGDGADRRALDPGAGAIIRAGDFDIAAARARAMAARRALVGGRVRVNGENGDAALLPGDADWIAAAPPIPARALLVRGQWIASTTPEIAWTARLIGELTAARPDSWLVMLDCHAPD